MPGIPDPGSQVGRHCAAAGASKAVAANSEERRGARAEFMGARGGDRGPCRSIAARQNRVTARSDRWLAAARQERPHGGDGTASQGLALAPGEGIGVVRACRKFKHRSRTTRDPPPQSCPLRAPPSIRPQPPARTDPRPHAAAFPPHEHTAPAPRPASDRNFAPHRHSSAAATGRATCLRLKGECFRGPKTVASSAFVRTITTPPRVPAPGETLHRVASVASEAWHDRNENSGYLRGTHFPARLERDACSAFTSCW